MPDDKTPAGNNRPNNSQKKNSGCGIILILIILILIFFLWPFINNISMNWTGNIQNPIVPASDNTQKEIPVSGNTAVLPVPGREDLQKLNTSTEYNTGYLRWSGRLKPGETAVWGRITIERSEIPVGGNLSPLAPSQIYGNLREVNGTGVDLMVFSEADFIAWRHDDTKGSAMINEKNVTDYDYSFNIDTGAYYVVVQNTNQDKEAYIGFTGVHVYERNLTSGESPYHNSNPPKCFWAYKKEKITLFQYIMKLIKPTYNVSVTPPSIF
jgi:hypothetical protein